VAYPTSTALNPNDTVIFNMECGAGQQAFGGGAEGPIGVTIEVSFPTPDNPAGWVIRIRNDSTAPVPGNDFAGYIVCADVAS
jgi:hypothetical protein